MSRTKKTVYCSLDLEGTGLDPKKDAIIEAGAVLFTVSKSGGLEFLDEFSELVKPPVPIPEFIQNLTSIKQADVESARPWAEVAPDFSKFVGSHIIVGQNIKFDLAFLESTGMVFEQGSIDTRELASVFLPNVRFYNLEFLMRFFGIPLTNHHRALEDSKSAAQLLQQLIQHFHTLPKNTQAQVAKLLKHSTLLYRELFQPQTVPSVSLISAGEGVAARTPPAVLGEQGSLFEPQKARERASAKILPDGLKEILGKPGRAFVELGFPEFSKDTLLSLARAVLSQKESSLLSVGSDAELAVLAGVGAKKTGEVLVFDDPKNYLCEFRLRKLLLAKSRPDKLATFLIKILLWRIKNPKGTLGALQLFADDYVFIELVAGHIPTCIAHAASGSCTLAEKLTEAATAAKIFTRHSAWLNLVENNLKNQLIDRAVFWDIAALEQALLADTAAQLNFKSLRAEVLALHDPGSGTGILERLSESEKRQISQSLDAIDLAFGLWSIVLARELLVTSQRVVDLELRETLAFGKIHATGRDLVKSLKDLLAVLPRPENFDSGFARLFSGIISQVNFLEEFLDRPKPGKVYWFDVYNARLRLKSQSVFSRFSRLGDFRSCLLYNLAFEGSVKQYYRRVFRDDSIEGLDRAVKRPKLSICTVSDLPEDKTPGSQKAAIRLLERILPQLSGRSLVLFNSQKSLEQVFENSAFAAVKSRVLVQKYTGHHWKNLENFEKASDGIWFLTVSNFLKNVSSLPTTLNLVLMRLPYETPGVLAEAYDPDEVFESYVLPKTALKLQAILKRLFSIEEPDFQNSAPGDIDTKKMIVLDPRLVLDYNLPLLTMLRRLCETQEAEFSQKDPQVYLL